MVLLKFFSLKPLRLSLAPKGNSYTTKDYEIFFPLYAKKGLKMEMAIDKYR